MVRSPVPEVMFPNTSVFVGEPLPKFIVPLVNERLPILSEYPFRLSVAVVERDSREPELPMELLTASWRVPPLTVVGLRCRC